MGARQLLRCLSGLEERLIMEEGWEVHMGTEIIFSSFLSFFFFFAVLVYRRWKQDFMPQTVL